MPDESTQIDISGISYYIDKGVRPCILRAWNNYHGYQKYDLPIRHFHNTRTCFYKFVPPTYGTLALPSHAFHLFVLHKWLSAISCTALFVVNHSHIFCVKYEVSKCWIVYDWPHVFVHQTLWDLQRSLSSTRYLILLFPLSKKSTLQQCIRDWRPKPTPYYIDLQKELLSICT